MGRKGGDEATRYIDILAERFLLRGWCESVMAGLSLVTVRANQICRAKRYNYTNETREKAR